MNALHSDELLLSLIAIIMLLCVRTRFVEPSLIIALTVTVLSAFGLLAVIVWHRRAIRPPQQTTPEFTFTSKQDTDRQTFIYEVAGLIKAATGLDTHIVALGKYEHLDIEVHRGMRCVGVVSVVTPSRENAVSERIRAMERAKADKRANTAYVVTAGSFSADQRRQAERAGVTLLDGATLRRIKQKAMQGGYAPEVKEPTPPTPSEISRWRPRRPAPTFPGADVTSALSKTQERKSRKPPWVEYR
jgi:hypothetical protein